MRVVVEHRGVDAPRVTEFECFEVGFEGVAEQDWGGVVVVGLVGSIGDLDLEAADEGVVNGFGAGGSGDRIRMIWT